MNLHPGGGVKSSRSKGLQQASLLLKMLRSWNFSDHGDESISTSPPGRRQSLLANGGSYTNSDEGVNNTVSYEKEKVLYNVNFSSLKGSEQAPSPTSARQTSLSASVSSPRGRGREAAFTLAEVLITLGIIGVVAAMTLPTLVQKYTEKATVTKLKKVYSTFSQAFSMAVQEYGTPDEWGFSSIVNDEETGYDNDINKNSSKIIFERLGKYLKLVKTCTPDNMSECVGVNASNYGGVFLDGTGFFVFSRNGACNENYGTNLQLMNSCGDIYVFLKGDKSGQERGKDIFAFHITKFGIYPKGTTDDKWTFQNFCYSRDKHYGVYDEACTAWVIFNENMDYLHCNDLSWQGKHACK